MKGTTNNAQSPLQMENTITTNDFLFIADKKLIEMYHNATKTFYCAGGHGKADSNERQMARINNELKRRNLPEEIPSMLNGNLTKGEFNGEGAI